MAEKDLVVEDIERYATLDDLYEDYAECNRCPLGYGEKKPLFLVNDKMYEAKVCVGEGVKNGIMFIGKGPDVEEAAKGKPFIGDSGDLLMEALVTQSGIPLDEELLDVRDKMLEDYSSIAKDDYKHIRDIVTNRVYMTNTTQCYCSRKKIPAKALNGCRARLVEEIRLVDPKVIAIFGSEAVSSLLGDSIKLKHFRGKILKLEIPGILGNGSRISYPIMPVLDPASVLKESTSHVEDAFLIDIENIIELYYAICSKGDV